MGGRSGTKGAQDLNWGGFRHLQAAGLGASPTLGFSPTMSDPRFSQLLATKMLRKTRCLPNPGRCMGALAVARMSQLHASCQAGLHELPKPFSLSGQLSIWIEPPLDWRHSDKVGPSTRWRARDRDSPSAGPARSPAQRGVQQLLATRGQQKRT